MRIDSLWPGLSVSTGVYGAGVLAQAMTDVGVDWVNVGAVSAVILLFAFIITKRDPQIQKENGDILKNLSDRYAEMVEHLATKESERQNHLASVFAAESQNQREQFNLWMTEVIKLAGRDVCEPQKTETIS